jgi:thymidylate kinase
MKIIALEGLPGAGKTSLLNQLEQDNVPHLITLEEHIFPEALFQLNNTRNNDDESIYQLHWEAKDALCRVFPGENVVMDRCYISCLAYNYAKAKQLRTPELYKRWKATRRRRLCLLTARPETFKCPKVAG